MDFSRSNFVEEGLVPSRVSSNQVSVITAGGHKTLLYMNVRVYRSFRALSQDRERVVL